jgi:transposase-like protein
MSTVKIVCPHCAFSKEVDRQRFSSGKKKVTCPKCQKHFPFSLDDDFTFENAKVPTRDLSKAALLAITFFLGGVGGHKFYLRKYLQGAIYLLFCWTAIPSLVA